MKPVKVSLDIKSPREKVFRAASNVDGFEKNIKGITRIEKLSEGPSGLGTRWKETRMMFGKESIEEMWFSKFEPPFSYEVSSDSHGVKYLTVFHFEDLGSSLTRVSVVFSGEAKSFFARIMGFLMAPLMRGTIKKLLKKDLKDLAHSLED